MSGGHFDYIQHRIDDVAKELETKIYQNGKLKSKEELISIGWNDPEYYEKYPEEKYHIKYSDEIIEEFKTGLLAVKIANIYIERIDLLLSGDDGEESFIERLNDNLDELYKFVNIIKKDGDS